MTPSKNAFAGKLIEGAQCRFQVTRCQVLHNDRKHYSKPLECAPNRLRVLHQVLQLLGNAEKHTTLPRRPRKPTNPQPKPSSLHYYTDPKTHENLTPSIQTPQSRNSLPKTISPKASTHPPKHSEPSKPVENLKRPAAGISDHNLPEAEFRAYLDPE